MKICEVCGRVADESEIGYTKSFLCEIDGVDYYEDVLCNCTCGSCEWVEAFECKICGAHTTEENQYYGFCNHCIDQSSTENMALEIGQEYKENVSINGFVAYLFTPNEIENILLDIAKKRENFENSAKEYCKDDLVCLARYMEEKCK